MDNTPKRKHRPGITENPNVRDYSNDPLVLKKGEMARAFIAKHGLPEDKPSKKTKKG